MDIDWTKIFTHLLSVSVAYVLALPVGWDREKEVRSAGLRTFPLVAVASCGYMLVAMSIVGSGARGRRIQALRDCNRFKRHQLRDVEVVNSAQAEREIIDRYVADNNRNC